MGYPFELVSGAIDGVNATFTTSVPYTPGTLAVYVSGQLWLHAGGNAWTETDPSTGVFDFAAGYVPLPGDTVAAFYQDTVGPLLETEVTPLDGTLEAVDVIDGSLAATDALAGTLAGNQPITGTLDQNQTLGGTLNAVEFLVGELEVCD